MIRTEHRERGFTLIEIALALMVASMGLLVIMGLFVGGLSAQQTTVDETHAALFAEGVMQSTQALAETDWNGLESYLQSPGLPPPAASFWDAAHPTVENQNRIFADGQEHTIRYIVKGTDIQECAVRYRMDVNNINDRILEVRLEVRGGEFENNDPKIYYTEIVNPLPK